MLVKGPNIDDNAEKSREISKAWGSSYIIA